MRLPPFRLLRPRTAAEAAGLLASGGADAMAVAGGTDLYPNMKRRQVTPRALVSLRGIGELRGCRAGEGGELRIGAGTTLRELVSDDAVHEHAPALARAAALVSSPQVRTVATVGGNLCIDTRCNYYDLPEGWRASIGFCLKAGSDVCRVAPGGDRCWAISSSDLAPVAVALDARVRLVGAGGERMLPAAELYEDDGIRYLGKRPDEILTDVIVPPGRGLRATYWKVRQRGSIDFPMLGVAAAVRTGEDGACEEARVVLGAVGSRPVRCPEAELALAGRRLEPGAIEAAAELATAVAKPMENADLTPLYRKRMVKVHVTRALAELAELG